MRQIIILLGLLYYAWQLNAQTSVPILDRRVTIKITNQPLGKVLNIISETAGFNFSYGNNIKVNRSVTIHAENRTVKEVLDQLFSNDISYQQIGNHLILQKKQVPKNSSRIQENTAAKQSRYKYIISGYIRDLYSGNGLPNTSVYEKQTLSTTLSGDFGYYQLSVTSKDPEITIRYSLQHYSDTTFIIKFENNGSLAMNINLKDPSYKPPQLEEIEVIDTPHLTTLPVLKPDSATTLPIPDTNNTLLAWKGTKINIRESQMGKWFINKYQKIAENNIRDSFFRAWQLTLVPPIGTNKTLSGLVTNKLSGNILIGYNGGVDGLEIGGLLNILKYDMSGVQCAGISNIVGGSTRGVQCAGAFNHNLGDFQGFQAAGLYNYNGADGKGMQAAGLININKGYFDGIQTAGTINIANEIEGGQIGGLINFAKKVKGFQLGFINVADTNTGVAIGFVNFIRNGIHQLEIGSNEENQYGLAYRSGTNKFYSILFANTRLPIKDSNTLMSYGWGVGTSFKVYKPLRFTLEATTQHLTFNFNSDYLNLLSKLSANLELKFFKGFAIFGGASLNHLIADSTDRHFASTFANFGTRPVFHYSDRYDQHMWIGYQFGLRLF